MGRRLSSIAYLTVLLCCGGLSVSALSATVENEEKAGNDRPITTQQTDRKISRLEPKDTELKKGPSEEHQPLDSDLSVDDEVRMDLEIVVNQILLTLERNEKEIDSLEEKLKTAEENLKALQSEEADIILLHQKLNTTEERYMQALESERMLLQQRLNETEERHLQTLESEKAERLWLLQKLNDTEEKHFKVLESQKSEITLLTEKFKNASEEIKKTEETCLSLEEQSKKVHPVTKCESGYVHSLRCGDTGDTTMDRCFNSKTYTIIYRTKFIAPPALSYGLYKLDTEKQRNVRIDIIETTKTASRFSIRFHTWNHSWTYDARISWMACGNAY